MYKKEPCLNYYTTKETGGRTNQGISTNQCKVFWKTSSRTYLSGNSRKTPKSGHWQDLMLRHSVICQKLRYFFNPNVNK